MPAYNSSTSSFVTNSDASRLEKAHDLLPPDPPSLIPTVRLEPGPRAWCTLLGTWLMVFVTVGYTYSFGVYQDFYTQTYATDYTPSDISWIGSTQLMLTFAMGLIAGRLVDAGYFRPLQITASILFCFSLFMLSLAKEDQYYQFFLSQGIGMGLGSGLSFVPSVSIQAVHFPPHRRTLATGLVLSGGGVGGVVFPIMINNLLKTQSFGNAVRASGYLVLGCLVLANCLMSPKPSNPPNGAAKAQAQAQKPPSLISLLKEPAYSLMALGMFIHILGIYFPIFYMQLFAVKHNVDSTLAIYSLAIINACTVIARPVANQLASRVNIYTLVIVSTIGTGATIWAILGITNNVGLVLVSIFYGITSGAVFSLVSAVFIQMSRSPKEAGIRVGLTYFTSGIANLFAAPIQGALLTSGLVWIRPVAFSATLCFVGAVLYALSGFFLRRQRALENSVMRG